VTGRVLYVDDQPQLPAQVDEVLAQVGYELVHTADPEEALRIARDQPPPALVLAEVLLPGCDGFELIERIGCVRVAPPLPVVVVTRGERTPQLYGQALELGVKDFLCKPVLRTQILEAVLAFARTEAGPARASIQSDEAPAPRSFAGDLAQQPLPELLVRLLRTGGSGVLSLQRGSDVRSVEFRNGSPVEVARHRNMESVADHLLHTRRIDAEQYEMLVDQLMARIAGPREILLGMRALDEEQLASAAHEQAREALLEMFRWPSGQYTFRAGERLEVADTVELNCEPREIVLAGLQRSPDEVIRDALDRRSQLYASLAPAATGRLDDARLSPEQRTDAESLTGECTIAEVLAASSLDPRTLYGLVAIGAVQLDEDPVLMLDQVLKPDEPEGFEPPQPDFPVEEARPRGPAQAVARESELGTTESTIRDMAARFDSQDDFELFGIDETTRDVDVRAAYNALLESVRLDRIPPECDELRALAARLRMRVERSYARVRSEDLRRAFATLRKKKVADRKEEEVGSRAVEAETWFRKGEGYLAQERYSQAVEAFGMSVHLDPKQGEYAAHLGWALYRSNPRSPLIRREALEHVAKGVKLAPGREKPLLFLARIFREVGEGAMAAKVLRRALKVNPDSPAVVQELCMIDAAAAQPRGKGLIERLRGR